MSEIKLLPCPFCGGEARISCDTEATRDSEGRLWAYTIVCNSCCATSGLTYTPDRAKEAWNTRKPIEDMVEQLERKKLESTECKAEAIAEMCGSSASRFGGEIYAYNKAIDIVRGGRE